MALDLVVAAILLCAASAVAAVLSRPFSILAQRLSAFFMVLSMFLGLAGASMCLLGQADSLGFFPWQAAGGSVIGLDALSAFFLVPVFLVGGLGSVYGLGYWPRSRYPGSARRLEAFWAALVAGLALLVIARHALSFLLGWELMALSAFFLVATEDFRSESRRASLVYLLATHIGTLVLFGLFVLWRKVSGSFAFLPLPSAAMGLGAMNALFFLAFLGFGLKAGIMPLHFWLPGAHASSPSHVSAILSGVVLKMGVYGLMRFLLLIEDPPAAWAVIVLVAGAASCLLGVVFAIGQHDLKRLLAYHSVENIGIIFMGLGLAMIGRAEGNDSLVVLGLAGCLLHVWNHSLFKSLLFLGAGSVLHATHTRDIERLGGLARSMPFTSALFLSGAVAICGLPPLNGFVSELFVYMGFFASIQSRGIGPSLAVMAAPVLAATGALAVACFVKAYGVVFLGSPRSPAAAQAHEAPWAMRLPMFALAACCALIGLLPLTVAPILDAVIAAWGATASRPLPGVAALAPLGTVGLLSAALAVGAAILALAFRPRSKAATGKPTWDCGYAVPTARMQYSASSFARSIVGLFHFFLKPSVKEEPVAGNFPKTSSLESHVDDAVLDRLMTPSWRAIERKSRWFRRFQQGLAQEYILFILVTVLVLLCTLLPLKEILAHVFAR